MAPARWDYLELRLICYYWNGTRFVVSKKEMELQEKEAEADNYHYCKRVWEQMQPGSWQTVDFKITRREWTIESRFNVTFLV